MMMMVMCCVVTMVLVCTQYFGETANYCGLKFAIRTILITM
jgi:hypothetical protein